MVSLYTLLFNYVHTQVVSLVECNMEKNFRVLPVRVLYNFPRIHDHLLIYNYKYIDQAIKTIPRQNFYHTCH